MAQSPREELVIKTITEFDRSEEDGEWYWATKAANGLVVGDGSQGYSELRKAVHGFFTQQGYDPRESHDPRYQRYSKLLKVNDGLYHIRKYAYGAPEPFDTDEDSMRMVGYL